MTLNKAIRIAADISSGRITIQDWHSRDEEIAEAFHRLHNQSRYPTTAENLAEQYYQQARIIWDFVRTVNPQ